jgi:hypothetical protein
MGTVRVRTLATAVLVLATLAGCAHGMGSRQRWTGRSNGLAGECGPLEFEVTTFEGRIEGWATSALPQGPVAWEVRGSVTPERQISAETVTDDPRIAQRRIMWHGVKGPLSVTLTQASGDCPPRTATLD